MMSQLATDSVLDGFQRVEMPFWQRQPSSWLTDKEGNSGILSHLSTWDGQTEMASENICFPSSETSLGHMPWFFFPWKKKWPASGDFLTNLYCTASVPYQGHGAAACLGGHGKSEIHRPQRQNRTERWGRREDHLEWVPLENPPDDTSDATLLWQWRLIACCLRSTDRPALVSRAFWILQLPRVVSVEVHKVLFNWLCWYIWEGFELKAGLHNDVLSENK